MKTSPNYRMNAFGCNNSAYQNKVTNPSFQGYKGHKDTERTPWGTTWGEERVAAEEAAAEKRMIQRETLKGSKDAWVRDEAENVGKNPIWDEYLTQREFNRYHEEEMQRRAEKAAKLAERAGIKQYEGNTYKICDAEGNTIEEGVGNKWTKRTEYLGGFNNGNKKDYYPDGTWIHEYSCLFQHYGKEIGRPDGSVEFYERTTNALEKIEYPGGARKEMQMPNYMFRDPATDAVKREIMPNGTIVKYDKTNYYHQFGRPDGRDRRFWAKNYKTEEIYPDGTTRAFKYDKAFNLREIKERDGSVTKLEIDPATSNNYVIVEKDSSRTRETLPDGTIVKYDLVQSSPALRTYQRYEGYTYYEKRFRTEEEYPDGTKRLYKYDDNLRLSEVVERDGSVTKVNPADKAEEVPEYMKDIV